MSASRRSRLIAHARDTLAGADSAGAEQLDALLTDCAAETLFLRTEIRRLEDAEAELEELLGQLRAARARAVVAQGRQP